jgi:DNA-directed RNA polymerase specialized sigma24 family protein
MKDKDSVLTQENFETLLAWLDVDREAAGKRYEEIRRKLIKIFTSRGCGVPEELADESIDRVIGKVTDLVSSYVGNPMLYFYGVAHKVHLEYLRSKPSVPFPSALAIEAPEEVEAEQEYECLENCIEQLTIKNRQLVLQYYRDEKQAKINSRKALAEKLGIAVSALRIRAFRIRATLEKCVRTCMSQAITGSTSLNSNEISA